MSGKIFIYQNTHFSIYVQSFMKILIYANAGSERVNIKDVTVILIHYYVRTLEKTSEKSHIVKLTTYNIIVLHYSENYSFCFVFNFSQPCREVEFPPVSLLD